jgi:hypothetical protein
LNVRIIIELVINGLDKAIALVMHLPNKIVKKVARNITLPPISPLGQVISQSNQSFGCAFSPKMSNDEEIEADLRELGGQMAGSILDF